MTIPFIHYQESADYIRQQIGSFTPKVAMVLGSGLGFFLAMVIFSGVRLRTENCDAPKAFKGLPITLVAAAIVALSFFGFAGVIDNLFK